MSSDMEMGFCHPAMPRSKKDNALDKPKDYAVVIGISNYKKAKSFLPLKGPTSDAKKFIELIKDDEVRVMAVGIKNDDTVTYKRIVKTFDELFAETVLKRGRRVYIYFSGHGFSVSPLDSSLIAADSPDDGEVLSLSSLALLEFIFASPFFDEIFLITDCCRKPNTKYTGRILPWIGIDGREIDPSGRIDLKKRYAAYGNGFGYDTEEAYDPTQETFRGIFSKTFEASLLSGMKRFRPFTTDHLTLELKKKMHPQRPQIHNFDTRAIILKDRRIPKTEFNLKLSIRSKLRDFINSITIFNGQDKKIDVLNAFESSSIDITVSTGLYQLYMSFVNGPDELHYFEIEGGKIYTSQECLKYVNIRI